MSAHTPAPWTVIVGEGYVVGPDEIPVAFFRNSEADGRLIAAAPEMLEALQGLAIYLDDQPNSIAGLDSGGMVCIKGSFLSNLYRAQAAIAKATGEA